MIRLETDADPHELRASVMLVCLDGFLDAGHAGRLAVDHLMAGGESRVVASFDIDSLIDYRARRPAMVFDKDHWASVEDPALVVHRVTDATGRPVLVLTGPEPDYRWEAFTSAVIQLCAQLGVRMIASLHGVPLNVPHTRPIGVSRYASDPVLLGDGSSVFGKVEVPGSAQALLHLRAAEAGLDTIGFAVHVPHYLMETRLVPATLAGLRALSAATGLSLRESELELQAELDLSQINSQISDDEAAQAIVKELERRYDEMLAESPTLGLLAGQVPSADQIGAEFETFLKDAARKERGQGSM